MANYNDDELFYMFFLKEKLEKCTNENEIDIVFEYAMKGLLAAIKYYPESNKIDELQEYFLAPALQLYRSSLPENKERPSYERPPSEAYPSRPASLRMDGNARPLSIKIVAAPTSTAAPPKPPKPLKMGSPVNFHTQTQPSSHAPNPTERRSTWFGGLSWTKK
jgi:hypothetical protein